MEPSRSPTKPPPATAGGWCSFRSRCSPSWEGAQRGEDTGRLAAAFHESVAEGTARAVVDLAARAGIGRVALGGGVFQNARLLEALRRRLECRGLEVAGGTGDTSQRQREQLWAGVGGGGTPLPRLRATADVRARRPRVQPAFRWPSASGVTLKGRRAALSDPGPRNFGSRGACTRRHWAGRRRRIPVAGVAAVRSLAQRWLGMRHHGYLEDR